MDQGTHPRWRLQGNDMCRQGQLPGNAAAQQHLLQAVGLYAQAVEVLSRQNTVGLLVCQFSFGSEWSHSHVLSEQDLTYIQYLDPIYKFAVLSLGSFLL